MKKFFRHALSLPLFGIGLVYVGLACLLGFAHGFRLEGDVFTATWRDWVAKRWHYTTTAGRGVIGHPEHRKHRERIWFHEMVHVRQQEDLCALGLLIAIPVAWLGQPYIAVLLWVAAPAGHLLGYLTAWLRGGDPYYDAEHERAAYSQERERFAYDSAENT